MKHRYIVRTYVDAESADEALRLARKVGPQEAYIDDRYWEKQGYPLKDEERKQVGFKS
jgi:hypothetical protein